MPQWCDSGDLIKAFAKEGFVLVRPQDESFLQFKREPHDLVHLNTAALVDQDDGLDLGNLAQDLEHIGQQIADPTLRDRIFGHLAETATGLDLDRAD